MNFEITNRKKKNADHFKKPDQRDEDKRPDKNLGT